MTEIAYHVSSAKVIQGEELTYVAVPGGRDESGERIYWIPCSLCTSQYSVRARVLRDMTGSGRDPICKICRRGVKIKPEKWKFRWWLNRYTLEELKEIAEDSYGPRETWPQRSGGPDWLDMALEVLSDFPYQQRESGLNSRVAA